jgi:hypothetical protein
MFHRTKIIWKHAYAKLKVVEKPVEVYECRFLGVECEKCFFDISREDV